MTCPPTGTLSCPLTAARSDRPHDQRTSRRTRPATCTVCRRVTSLSLRREREHGNDDPASSGLHGVDENDPRSDADEGAERSRGGGPDLGRWCEGIPVDSSGEQRPDPAASRGWATGSGIVEVARSRSPPAAVIVCAGGDRQSPIPRAYAPARAAGAEYAFPGTADGADRRLRPPAPDVPYPVGASRW